MILRGVAITLVSVCAVLACNGGLVTSPDTTGSTGEQLVTTKDGQPTGNGTTCSWANTAIADSHPSLLDEGPFVVGVYYVQVDGCKTCTCTVQGISCVEAACSSPDTNYVVYPPGTAPIGAGAAIGPDAGRPQDCSATSGRICPSGKPATKLGGSCTYGCPEDDGGTVTLCDPLAGSAENDVEAVINANLACTQDSDCEVIGNISNCFDTCERVLAKAGQSAYDDAIAKVNANQCQTFQSRACPLIHPPCAPLGTAHCVNHACAQTQQ